MPGNIQFRPVEANLTHDTDWLGKMDPYCKFSIGANHAKSSVCRHGGTRPHWGDIVSLPIGELTGITANVVRLEVFDKDKFRPDDHIAYTDIDLSEIQQRGTVSKWYPLYHRRKPAGEILIEAAIQQPMVVQQVIPTTTYVQETVVTSAPVETIVGESYVVNEFITQGTTLQSGIPLNQGVLLNQSVPLNQGVLLNQGVPLNQGLIESTTLGSYTTTTVDPNLALYNNNVGLTNTGLVGTNPGLASKVSALGPSGGLPHGNRGLKGLTNAGYSERPGYTLGDTEANPTCQSNLDSNGGGLFNKPGRERRVEPYSLSNPGTYGIPHGQTIDTSGHLRPEVALQRQAPIGTINHPGITGYPDGYTTPQQALAQQASYGIGLNQPNFNQGSNF